MQILLRGIGRGPRLADWEPRPFAPGSAAGPGPADHCDLYEQKVAQEEPGLPAAQGCLFRLAKKIGRYEIFPPSMITGVLRRSPVATGDTVGILFHAPLGLELFFAARVIDCFEGRFTEDGREVFRSGFTYRTLRGHPELGEETFAVEKDLVTGEIRVFLRSWSRPGIFLSRVFVKLLRHLQTRACRAALGHLAQVATAAV